MGTEVSGAAARFRPRVYVPNSASSTVDVIDPRTFRIVRRFGVGVLPHHVTPAWNLGRLYVNNTIGNSLTVVDPRSARPVGTVPVHDPYNLYFTHDGRRAIVVAERERRLDFRSPRSWRLIKSVPIPGRGPDHLDFSSDGRFLLISNEFSGDLVKVDALKMKVVARARVGRLPVDVRLAPDGTIFYVADQGLGGVLLFDARRMRSVGFRRTGAGAHGLCVSRDARKL